MEQGVNIKSARGSGSDRDRFGLYIVKGQALDTDDDEEDEEENFIEPQDQAIDSAVFGSEPGSTPKRFRPYVYPADSVVSKAECKQVAEWIARQRAGASREWQFTTGKWTQSTGKAWALNKKTLVTDPFMSLDAVLLIYALGFRFGKDGSETRIGVCFPEKYELLDTAENIMNVRDAFDDEDDEDDEDF